MVGNLDGAFVGFVDGDFVGILVGLLVGFNVESVGLTEGEVDGVPAHKSQHNMCM